MHNPAPTSATRSTCETWRNDVRPVLAAVVVSLVLVSSASGVVAQHAGAEPERAGAEQPGQGGDISEEAVSAGHTAVEQHEESPWAFAGKLFNFTTLVGLLVYFLRKPVAEYLTGRSTQIRTDLVAAARTKEEAAQQITEIDAKLKALPTELEMLRARGQQEIAAEETRIDEAAGAERDRLLEQTRREIDLQLRAARRDLVTHAADLAVQVARERIRSHMTTDDQRRLVDRYLEQVTTHE